MAYAMMSASSRLSGSPAATALWNSLYVFAGRRSFMTRSLKARLPNSFGTFVILFSSLSLDHPSMYACLGTENQNK